MRSFQEKVPLDSSYTGDWSNAPAVGSPGDLFFFLCFFVTFGRCPVATCLQLARLQSMRSGWAGEFMGSSMPDVESLIGLSCPLEARVMWNAGIGKPKKKVTTGMGTNTFR